jgi:hypothetical protein
MSFRLERHRRHGVPWSFQGRLAATIPVFLVLWGILFAISLMSSVNWPQNDLGPSDRTIATLSPSTKVSFEQTRHSLHCPNLRQASSGQASGLCGLSDTPNRYPVQTHHLTLTVRQRKTGLTQKLHVLLRMPRGFLGKTGGIIFLHGAGSYTDTDSFEDVAHYYASAGYTAMTLDKPTWKTNPTTRDYRSSADAYEKALSLLRSLPWVNPDAVGCYLTSESGWIMPMIEQHDHHIAFQILNAPMLFSPRVELGFFVVQDFSLVGTNAGYIGIVNRLLSVDIHALGTGDADIDPFTRSSFAIPTFFAQGSRDTMTPQVDGTMKILRSAYQAGNRNVVVRNYPMANHILRIGSQAQPNTQLADGFMRDTLTWANGIVRHERQTAPVVAGDEIHQSLRMPVSARSSRARTFYLVILNVLALLGLLVVFVFSVVLLIRRLIARHRHHNIAPLFVAGFGRTLTLVAGTTVLAGAFFLLGLAVTITRVVDLDWGGTTQVGGMAEWGWNVAQIACIVVIWAWSSIFVSLLEIAIRHGKLAWLRWLNPHHWKHVEESEEEDQGPYENGPVISLSKIGQAYAITVMVSMFLVLLVFAYWGLFIY